MTDDKSQSWENVPLSEKAHLFGHYDGDIKVIDFTNVSLAVRRLRKQLIFRMCRPNKPVNTFENAREQEEIIKEEFEECFGKSLTDGGEDE